MTKLAPKWVRTSDPVIRSPARYRWTTAPTVHLQQITQSLLQPVTETPVQTDKSDAPARTVSDRTFSPLLFL